MRTTIHRVAILPLAAALALAGCGARTHELPDDPIERAATCGVITAAAARGATGVKGELSAEAQGRIFHYPLLAGSQGERFDDAAADAVFKRMPAIFDQVVKGKWREGIPRCATAYPATQVTHPELPPAPLDRALQCYMLTDFMRKGLAGQGPSYAEAAAGYGGLSTRLDGIVAALLRGAGIRNGDTLQARRKAALAAAAKLGQPATVIAVCKAKYD